MADSSTERRMFCLQLTLQSFAGQATRPEDVVMYASVLEEYLKNGKSKLEAV